MPRFLSVIYVLTSRMLTVDAQKEFDEYLAAPVDEQQRRDEWGTGPTAVAEQNAMMALVQG